MTAREFLIVRILLITLFILPAMGSKAPAPNTAAPAPHQATRSIENVNFVTAKLARVVGYD